MVFSFLKKLIIVSFISIWVTYNTIDGSKSSKENSNNLSKSSSDIPKSSIKTAVEQIPVVKLKEYKIELSAINQGNRKLKINLKTNFPDGTNLSLQIYRIYYLKGKSEAYSGELFVNDFSVKNGRIEAILNIIDDTEWYNKYQGLIKALPNDMPPISKISDKITIVATFVPGANQPANVLKILGTKGEFITGKGSKKNSIGFPGQFTSFEVSTELSIPFRK